jgi:endoglucanase
MKFTLPILTSALLLLGSASFLRAADAAPGIIRIKTGITAPLTDETGVVWQADTGFTDGETIDRPGLAIANTKTPSVYSAERYGMSKFRQKLPNGKYTVKLHFAETYEGIYGPGERVFSFKVEDKEVKDFDVWKKSGGALRAHVETVEVAVTDGSLDITFNSQIENSQINALEIIPAS